MKSQKGIRTQIEATRCATQALPPPDLQPKVQKVRLAIARRAHECRKGEIVSAGRY